MAVQDWVHLGKCIARDRKRRQWLQSDLAERAGLAKRTIGNYERGVGRAAGSEDIPAGYYAVAGALGWPAGAVERALAGVEPTMSSHRAPVDMLAPAPLEPAELFPAVGRFARAAVAAGGDPALRDLLEDAADRLLQSIPKGAPAQSSYGLAAYRPHGWAEGDPSVPADDAARIRQALEEYTREQGKS
jgi:transcriptional regulator with XRE-family HTH domain